MSFPQVSKVSYFDQLATAHYEQKRAGECKMFVSQFSPSLASAILKILSVKELGPLVQIQIKLYAKLRVFCYSVNITRFRYGGENPRYDGIVSIASPCLRSNSLSALPPVVYDLFLDSPPTYFGSCAWAGSEFLTKSELQKRALEARGAVCSEPFFDAVKAGDFDSVALCLTRPDLVDRNAQDANGRTALHLAEMQGWTEIVALLKDARCASRLEDFYGYLPEDYQRIT